MRTNAIFYFAMGFARLNQQLVHLEMYNEQKRRETLVRLKLILAQVPCCYVG